MKFRQLTFLIFFSIIIYICIIFGYITREKLGKSIRLSTISTFDDVVLQTSTGNRTFIRVKDLFESEYRKSFKMLYGHSSINHGASLTLVTQTHVENLYLLDSLARRWNGPISIAVFIDRDNSDLIQQVRYYHHCYPHVKANTSVHILCPVNSVLTFQKIDCSKHWSKSSTQDETQTVKGMPYPHNLMRNLAFPEEDGGFIFYIDIDMVPSWNVHDTFLNLSNSIDQSVLNASIFILPAFESKNFNEVPGDRIALLEGLKGGQVQTFHNRSCPKCQNDTQYNKWFDSGSRTAMYPINRTNCAYEPFYIISKDRHLLYDERFIGRGYDRISQVTEIWLSGLDFYVLRDSFIVHRGFHDAPPPLPLQSPPLAPITLHPNVYKERHIEFLRAKYLLDRRYREKIELKFGKQRVDQIERKLSISEYRSKEAILREIKKIAWLKDFDVDESVQYQLYMKHGEKGYDEIITTERSEAVEDPMDPNKYLFLSFLVEKTRMTKKIKRRFCIL